jgi:hypothetical protein
MKGGADFRSTGELLLIQSYGVLASPLKIPKAYLRFGFFSVDQKVYHSAFGEGRDFKLLGAFSGLPKEGEQGSGTVLSRLRRLIKGFLPDPSGNKLISVYIHEINLPVREGGLTGYAVLSKHKVSRIFGEPKIHETRQVPCEQGARESQD